MIFIYILEEAIFSKIKILILLLIMRNLLFVFTKKFLILLNLEKSL